MQQLRFYSQGSAIPWGAQIRRLLLALSLASVAAGLASPAGAQRHPEDKFGHDAEGAYVGLAYREDEDEEPDIAFPSQGIELRSWLTLADLASDAISANDCWGYTSLSGREYALIGLSDGTTIVEVTEPGNAQVVATVSGPSSQWRDIKTYDQYAYAVSEGGGGIQVIDLSDIDNGTVSLVNTVLEVGNSTTHNLAINEQSGRLYRLGGAGFGLQSYDLSDPTSPSYEGLWDSRYCHDAQIVTWTEAPLAGSEIAFCYSNTSPTSGAPGIDILDVTDMANVSTVGAIDLTAPPIFSHAALYSHQGWLSSDRQFVYINDEVDEGSLGNTTLTRVVDVSDLTNPVQVATFTNGNSARDHNLYTVGNILFEANYRSGLRVFDATDPTAPTEIAFFDTYPDNDNANYNGLWSVYPFFSSGTLIGSDIEKGLFVWTLSEDCQVTAVEGATPTDCTEGNEVAHGSLCTWTADPGFVCEDLGPQQCVDGTFSATPACTVAPLPVPALSTLGVILGALGLLGVALRQLL